MNERQNKPKKLTKSRTDRKVDGVIGGVAEYFGWDSTLLRVLYIILLFPSFGSALLLYIILDMVMPNPPREASRPSEPNDTTQNSGKSNDDNWSDF
ncbi:PspC domain-containing protein [Schleiferilactobacillus perolens]|jgi:phage shock protein C|uniref:PspC domain-containing protein n=1 Tax=Schleiferilactobacillus perolens TaxID=100468 RepID=UPI002352C4E7|nr:PspC domain-containing protein [Schleiferilactobacillus perolens]MCI1892236.1 PspC domain-containing protein [Schleiferilactobacillus harbinensis]MCI1912354.1 PspC domain-containing protein [Schleiferilactobacillus harbinensis]MCI2170229.1 PspC domain-containing protein [Schleiferilactobacillus perolens]